METHAYNVVVKWTGDLGHGTANYSAYERNHEIKVEGKPSLLGSSDAAFRGDPSRWNPEDSLLSSISACHMLWFLHIASEVGWVVRSYVDRAHARMQMNANGSGQFVSAHLRPEVEISSGDPSISDRLHHRAHDMCFIARSLNFDILCDASVTKRA
ncbi:MAG: OsmC family protein [Pseudomonadota bacterium]